MEKSQKATRNREKNWALVAMMLVFHPVPIDTYFYCGNGGGL
jgi:hypothetical protein